MSGLLRGLAIDAALVHRLLYSEYNRFQESFEDEDERAEQELRGCTLLWWATFAPELFPASLTSEIVALLRRSVDSGEHQTFGWNQTIALCGALARVTGYAGWLNEAIDNISHHNSSLRQGVASELALAMPCVPCDTPALVDGVRANFEAWHFFAGDGAALYAASRGTKAEKAKQITRWCSEINPKAPGYNVLLALRDGGIAPNPFAPFMGRLHRYLTLRLATAHQESPMQLSGVLVNVPRGHAEAIGSEVWERLEKHPLVGAYIELADV